MRHGNAPVRTFLREFRREFGSLLPFYRVPDSSKSGFMEHNMARDGFMTLCHLKRVPEVTHRNQKKAISDTYVKYHQPGLKSILNWFSGPVQNFGDFRPNLYGKIKKNQKHFDYQISDYVAPH